MVRAANYLGFIFLVVWATPALAQLTLERPFGMCFDEAGNLYIAEITNKRLTVLDSQLQVVRHIEEIEGYGRLGAPFDIKRHSGNFYILDSGRGNILIVDDQWRLLRRIGADAPGSAAGELAEPHALAVDRDGSVFVTDTFNHRIQHLDPQGAHLASIIGTQADGTFGINMPSGIGILPNGNLVIAEYGSHPPVITDRTGKVLRQLESHGAAYVVHVSRDRIFVSYTYSNFVGVYDHDGTMLFTIGNSQDSAEPGKLNKPGGVITDRDGNILITEWRNKRLQKFSPQGQFITACGGYLLDGSVEFPQIPRKDPKRPVLLSAFTRILSPKQIKAYHDAGFNKLCMQPGEDVHNRAIKQAVEAAHQLGMKVDLAFDVYYYGARPDECNKTDNGLSAFANENPQFFTLKRDGKTRNREVLSYAYPEVRRFKVQAAVTMIRQSGADGIVLDYIRWPAGNTDGYDPPITEAFEREHGISAFAVEPTDPRWAKCRASFITKFISELHDELVKLERPVSIGVFVDANPEAELISVGRDWATWAEMGIITNISQMLYEVDWQTLYNGVTTGRRHAGKNLSVTSCIDVYCGVLHTADLLHKGAWVSLLGGADEVMVVRDGAMERMGVLGWVPEIRNTLEKEVVRQ